MTDDYINCHTALFIVACAGALNHKLYQLIGFQNEQIRVLKRLRSRKEKLTDADRRRLAALAQWIDNKTLELAETIVTIASIRRWYRRLIARKYTAKKRGRPRVSVEIEELAVQIAWDNPIWGEDSIADRLSELGYKIDDRTVGRILRRYGVPPAQECENNGKWDKFISINFPDLCSIDFADHEVLN